MTEQTELEQLRAELAKERNDRRRDVEAGIKRAEKAEAELEAERKKNRELELSRDIYRKMAQNFDKDRNRHFDKCRELWSKIDDITAELNHYKQLVEESRKQEPVAWVFDAGDDLHGPDYYGVALTDNGGIPLYAAPIVPQEVPEEVFRCLPGKLPYNAEDSNAQCAAKIGWNRACDEMLSSLRRLAAAPDAPKGDVC